MTAGIVQGPAVPVDRSIAYCLPTQMYTADVRNSVLHESDTRKINVIWNYCRAFITFVTLHT